MTAGFDCEFLSEVLSETEITFVDRSCMLYTDLYLSLRNLIITVSHINYILEFKCSTLLHLNPKVIPTSLSANSQITYYKPNHTWGYLGFSVIQNIGFLK